MIKRKYVVLSLLTLVSIMLGSLLYSNLAKAQSTVTGYVSVSAATFVVSDSTKVVHNSGWELLNFEAGWVYFVGSVQLPDGATVTKFTFYWYDAGVSGVTCELTRCNQTVMQGMAWNQSFGDAGRGSSYDDTINYATVDNSHYAYYVKVNIGHPYPGYKFYYAIIEYTLPSEGAVGGLWIPVDKLSLLAPYIALVSTIVLAVSVSVAYIKHRKKQ